MNMIIENRDQYGACMDAIKKLIEKDPDENSIEGNLLRVLANVVKEYEDCYF